MGFPSYTGYPPLSKSHSLSKSLKISEDGWWIFTTISFPLYVCSLRRLMTFSESEEESPEVGSSRKRTEGSLISSRAMFSLLRCPPEIYLFIAEPTFKSLEASRPRSIRIDMTFLCNSSSGSLSKQSLAVNQRF